MVSAQRRINWHDDRLIVSTREAARVLRMGWRTARAHMASGRIPSVPCGIASQPYYRTSYKTLRAFMDGKLPIDNSGPSGVTAEGQP